jgi:antitoxin ParD1/3/4
MPQINVSVPEALKAWVDGHVAKGLHNSPSDFIRDALRQVMQDEQRLAVLQAEIEKGRQSGPGRDAFEVFSELRSKYGSRAVEG